MIGKRSGFHQLVKYGVLYALLSSTTRDIQIRMSLLRHQLQICYIQKEGLSYYVTVTSGWHLWCLGFDIKKMDYVRGVLFRTVVNLCVKTIQNIFV